MAARPQVGCRARTAADAVKPRDPEATGEDGLPPDISPYVRESIGGRSAPRGGGGISGGRERQLSCGHPPGTTGNSVDDERVRELRAAAWVAKRLGISRWAVYELAKTSASAPRARRAADPVRRERGRGLD